MTLGIKPGRPFIIKAVGIDEKEVLKAIDESLYKYLERVMEFEV